jgi:TrmH family RNA methyltransferase
MAMKLGNIRIVLVRPIYGGNVGSVSRAMANMGLSDLAIASPRQMDMQEARMMACHASDVLDGRREFDTLDAAVSDCGAVFGTTARGGLYRQHARTAREWAPKALEFASTRKVAFVFGPEDNGMTNEELALCTHIVQIPTTEDFSSINVSQAVLICGYELFLATQTYEPPEEKSPPATSAVRERMFTIWRETLMQVGFMEIEKADHMMLGLRRIMSRGAVTMDDVKISMGIARQAAWAAKQGNAVEDPCISAREFPDSGVAARHIHDDVTIETQER